MEKTSLVGTLKSFGARKKLIYSLFFRTAFNLSIILLIVRYIYYPITKNKDYLFTYLLISLTVFLLCILLDSVKIELAFAICIDNDGIGEIHVSFLQISLRYFSIGSL